MSTMSKRGWTKWILLLACLVVAIAVCGWLRKSFSFYDRRGVIWSVAIDPSGRWIASAGRYVGTAEAKHRGDVKICDVRTGKAISLLSTANDVWGSTFDSTGGLLAFYAPVAGDRSLLSFYRVSPSTAPAKVHEEMLHFIPRDAFAFVTSYFIAAGDGQAAILKTQDWTKCSATDSDSSGVTLGELVDMVTGLQKRGSDEHRRLYATSRPAGLEEGVPVALLAPGEFLIKGNSHADLRVWSSAAAASTRPLPESKMDWIGYSATEDGHAILAWTASGKLKVWNIGAEEISVAGELDIPRLSLAAFAGSTDVVAVAFENHVTTTRTSDGGSGVADYAAGGVELWSLGKAKRLYQFPEVVMELRWPILATYLAGGEEVTVWDINNPAAPKLLYVDRWRNNSLSVVPLPE